MYPFLNLPLSILKYFLYFDDTDFMYRANRKGYNIRLCQDCFIFHKVSLSTGGEHSPVNLYYSTRNRLYFIQKNRMGTIAMLFTYSTRRIKIIVSGIRKTDDRKYIREAIKDFRAGKMYRKENLLKI